MKSQELGYNEALCQNYPPYVTYASPLRRPLVDTSDRTREAASRLIRAKMKLIAFGLKISLRELNMECRNRGGQ